MNSFAVDWSTAVLLTLLAIVGLVHLRTRHRRKVYPPGPSPWPIFGNIGFNKGICMKRLLHFQRQTGDVMTFYAGRLPVIMLGSYDSVVEAFVRHANTLSSRPVGLGRLVASSPDSGILYSPFPIWKELRRFVLHAFRQIDKEGRAMEAAVVEEASCLVAEVAKRSPGAFDIEMDLYNASANVVACMLFGTRFKYTDPDFVRLMDTSRWRLRMLPIIQLVEAVPLLKRLPGDLLGYHNYKQRTAAQLQYFRNIVQTRRHADRANKTTCLVDEFVHVEKALTNDTDTFTEDNILAVIAQLFTAGSETTANVLRWAFLFMILNPHHQERVQQEIDRHIGNRLPSEKDDVMMPFTQAVLAEVLRLGCTAPVSPMRVASANVVVCGQLIPKGTAVVANIMSAHLDDSTFVNSSQFCPERFLDDNGFFKKPQRLLAFGAGRRACLGERLARLQIFLFFTSILQKYTLRATDEQVPTADGCMKLAYGPIPFSMHAYPREICPNTVLPSNVMTYAA